MQYCAVLCDCLETICPFVNIIVNLQPPSRYFNEFNMMLSVKSNYKYTGNQFSQENISDLPRFTETIEKSTSHMFVMKVTVYSMQITYDPSHWSEQLLKTRISVITAIRYKYCFIVHQAHHVPQLVFALHKHTFIFKCILCFVNIFLKCQLRILCIVFIHILHFAYTKIVGK